MLQNIKTSPELFLDKTTVIIGPEKSGKSTIIKDSLFHLKDHVGEIFNISTEDLTNGTLEKLWQRAREKTSAYLAGNNMVLLEKVFTRLELDQINKDINDLIIGKNALIKHARSEYTDRNILNAKLDEIETQFTEIIKKIYKINIHNNKNILLNYDLSCEECMCMEYLYFNPKTLIVLDGISSQIKWLDDKTIHDLLFRGRYNFVTFIVSMLDYKLMDIVLLRYFHNMIHTSQKRLNLYFDEAWDSPEKKLHMRVAGREVFDKISYEKLLYIRCAFHEKYSDGCFYKYLATYRADEDFKFENKFTENSSDINGDIKKNIEKYLSKKNAGEVSIVQQF